jgi:hypothetical protein
LTGPELNRGPLRAINTPVSIKGIDEGAHATVLYLLRPLRRGVKAAKNSWYSDSLLAPSLARQESLDHLDDIRDRRRVNRSTGHVDSLLHASLAEETTDGIALADVSRDA